MNKYGDELFANKRYGYEKYPSKPDFIKALIFSKLNISNNAKK